LNVNVAFLQELLGSIADRGRALLPRSLFGAGAEVDVEALSRVLISGRGEASGVAIAGELLDRYAQLDAEDRLTFFRFLATELGPDAARVAEAAQAYLDKSSGVALARLQKALDTPRLEFFRRLNLAPGATAEIVAMRRDLLAAPLDDDPSLAAVDADLRRLLYSWFNRGFLVLRRIDWNTPAAILEKIIRYEAVHEIKSWDDLRRRLDPADRRCFAFFHPSLVDEPLVFVEVALTRDMPAAINEVLNEPQAGEPGSTPTTAVFYSISNCQEGLKEWPIPPPGASPKRSGSWSTIATI
jgi:malonyl-CoA decarboxylase